MGDRLGEIIHHYRFTMNSFAKKLGLSSNTVITKAVKENKRGVNQRLLTKILTTFPDVDAHWLVTGQGQMLKTYAPFECLACNEKDRTIAENERSIKRLKRTIDLAEKTIEHLLASSNVDLKLFKD